MSGIADAFQNVDTSDSDFLIQFLADANRLPTVVDGFRTQLQMLDIIEGDHVLDIGCGIGERAAQMAELVGPTGKVIGTDLSDTMVSASRQRYGDSGLPVEFHVAEACEQPFPDRSFDKVRTERVLMYVSDIPRAFSEFRRVLKDGGKLLVVDFAWDSLIFGHGDAPLTRRITHYVCDSFPNGRIGADLFRTFHDFNFTDIDVRPLGYTAPLEFTRRVIGGILDSGVQNGNFSNEEIDGWWLELEEADRKGVFLTSFQGFIVAGIKQPDTIR